MKVFLMIITVIVLGDWLVLNTFFHGELIHSAFWVFLGAQAAVILSLHTLARRSKGKQALTWSLPDACAWADQGFDYTARYFVGWNAYNHYLAIDFQKKVVVQGTFSKLGRRLEILFMNLTTDGRVCVILWNEDRKFYPFDQLTEKVIILPDVESYWRSTDHDNHEA